MKIRSELAHDCRKRYETTYTHTKHTAHGLDVYLCSNSVPNVNEQHLSVMCVCVRLKRLNAATHPSAMIPTYSSLILSVIRSTNASRHLPPSTALAAMP